MTEDRITDSRRIAQLLASELSGLERGPLGAVSVEGADADATPSERGTEAYQVTYHESPVATVSLYPEHTTVRLRGDKNWATATTDGMASAERAGRASSGGLSVEGSELRIQTGAAVKRAVDRVASLVGGADSNEDTDRDGGVDAGG